MPAGTARRLLHGAAPQMSMPEWALRFAASHKNVVMVLSGMSTLQQVEENIGTMRPFQPLTQLQMARALEAGHLIRTSTAVPCTACPLLRWLPGGYCNTGIFFPVQSAFAFGKKPGRGGAGICRAGPRPRHGVSLYWLRPLRAALPAAYWYYQGAAAGGAGSGKCLTAVNNAPRTRAY